MHNLLKAATEYANQMNGKSPQEANETLQCGAKALCARFDIGYEDAKAAIRMCLDRERSGDLGEL